MYNKDEGQNKGEKGLDKEEKEAEKGHISEGESPKRYIKYKVLIPLSSWYV